MPNYHVTRLIIFLQTLYYHKMQNSSSSFQLWVMSFDLFSHCAVSSLKLIHALNFWRYLLRTGELLFCSCCSVCHTEPLWSSVALHSGVGSNLDSNSHTLSFALPLKWKVCMCGWRLKRKILNIILLKCAESWYWQWVGWKPTLSKEWSVGKKWYDSWWFKLRNFSLQLRCAQSAQAGYYYTLSEQ